jgi:hypothetical protein
MILGGIIIFTVFVLPTIQKVSDYSKNITEENKLKSKQKKQVNEITLEANNQQKLYRDKKKKSKYLSNEHLKKIYKDDKQSLHPLEQLALEELLVERNLIKYSPTQEKLQYLEKHFLNKQEKPYQKTSEKELEEFASILSFLIKNHNSIQKKKIYTKSKELAKCIFYSAFRDIGLIPVAIEFINLKKIPNQIKYNSAYKTTEDFLLELPKNREIIDETFKDIECIDLIKQLIKTTSNFIIKIENNQV